MDMQTKGPGAGWFWLTRGLNIGFQHPKVLFGAGALFLVYAVVVNGLQILVQDVLKPPPGELLAFIGLMMLVGAVISPILCGGFLRVMDAADHGRPARALGLFDAFRAGHGAGQLVVLGLCLMLVYVVLLALLYFTVGHDVGAWYMQTMAQMAHGGKDVVMPPLPSGFAATVALLLVFYIFYSAAFAIAMGQVALCGQAPLAALRDGLVGALKSVLPLMVLAITGMIGAIVFVVGVAIALVVITLLASLIGSKVVALVLVGAIYLALLLLLCVVVVGVMYAIWQDVADGGQRDAIDVPVTSVEA